MKLQHPRLLIIYLQFQDLSSICGRANMLEWRLVIGDRWRVVDHVLQLRKCIVFTLCWGESSDLFVQFYYSEHAWRKILIDVLKSVAKLVCCGSTALTQLLHKNYAVHWSIMNVGFVTLSHQSKFAEASWNPHTPDAMPSSATKLMTESMQKD